MQYLKMLKDQEQKDTQIEKWAKELTVNSSTQK